MKIKKRILLFLILFLAAFDAVVWYASAREARGNILSVSFLDVGQGDAIYIEAPNGTQVVIDGGPDASLVQKLGEEIPFYDRTLDALVITNPDKDHFAGFIQALARYKVGEIIEPGTQSASAIFATFNKRAKEEGAQKTFPKTGDKFMLDTRRGVALDVLFPDRDASGLDTNDGSLITRLSYGDVCFLLMGDAPQAIEKYLVRLYGDSLHCQVLKAGHHGSKTSSAPEFMKTVAPEYTVISVGKGNTYGHPNQETLDTLKTSKTKILRTDEEGTITFETDGNTLEVK